MFSEYLSLSALVLGMNVFPILMPPTWTVLAYYSVKYGLPVLPTVLIGASSALVGRVLLYNISSKFFSKLLSKESQENYDNLGKYFDTNKKLTIPLVFSYMFFPIPSNDIFIAAGLAKANIKLLAGAFFVGRLISYTFWIDITRHFFKSIDDIFNLHYSKTNTFIFEIAGLLVLYLVGKIAWKKILKNSNKTAV